MKLLKYTFRYLETQAFILHLNKKTYKIFSPIGSVYQDAELQANKAALLARFWMNNVVEVKPFFTSLAMPKGKQLVQKKIAEQFLENGLQQALLYPSRPVCDLIDLDRLRELEQYGLKRNLISKAADLLVDFKLPATSAHGDLHAGNMIVINNELKIIDWTMYNSKGSFITDYIHYYNYQDARRFKKSWTQTIFQETEYLQRLTRELGIPADTLRLAYVLSRIYGEVCQERELKFIPPKQIEKYNYALENLIANAS